MTEDEQRPEPGNGQRGAARSGRLKQLTRSSRSRHNRAMTVTIEIESVCCCRRPAVAGRGSSDPMVAQGEQPLGPLADAS